MAGVWCLLIEESESVSLKKRNELVIVDFAVLVNHKVKVKESEKLYKYQELSREKKRLKNKEGSDTNSSLGLSNNPNEPDSVNILFECGDWR